MIVTFTHPIQPKANAYRGIEDHGVEGPHTRYIVDGSEQPDVPNVERPASVPPTRTVTHTYQVPVGATEGVRILPQDPQRTRALLQSSGQVVYVTSLHGGPQADYGYPVVPGQDPLELKGENQLYGLTASGAAVVYVLIEREVDN